MGFEAYARAPSEADFFAESSGLTKGDEGGDFGSRRSTRTLRSLTSLVRRPIAARIVAVSLLTVGVAGGGEVSKVSSSKPWLLRVAGAI